jgi:hypothetical protein
LLQRVRAEEAEGEWGIGDDGSGAWAAVEESEFADPVAGAESGEDTVAVEFTLFEFDSDFA